jgi:hypothetical protein
MRTTGRVFAAIAAIVFSASSAAAQDPAAPAQDRRFLFSVSTIPVERPRATVQVDSGFGERAFDVTDSDRPEQRLSVQAFLGHRVTFLGKVGVSTDESDLRSSQQGELLYGVVHAPKVEGSLAVGMGIRHEPSGVNVLLGRVVAGRSFNAWRLDGNALFEKPYATGRDAVDLITTMGVSRRLKPALYAGIEFIGEDLEGFWEAAEAEGGARILIGPSIRVAPPNKRWQVSVAGGPMIHATQSGLSSEATRGLAMSGGDSGYAVRAALSVEF